MQKKGKACGIPRPDRVKDAWSCGTCMWCGLYRYMWYTQVNAQVDEPQKASWCASLVLVSSTVQYLWMDTGYMCTYMYNIHTRTSTCMYRYYTCIMYVPGTVPPIHV